MQQRVLRSGNSSIRMKAKYCLKGLFSYQKWVRKGERHSRKVAHDLEQVQVKGLSSIGSEEEEKGVDLLGDKDVFIPPGPMMIWDYIMAGGLTKTATTKRRIEWFLAWDCVLNAE